MIVAQYEPVVNLPNGASVLLAVFQIVTGLQQRGHTISVEDGEVLVTPDDDLDCDTLYLLESNRVDVATLLAASRVM